MSTQLSPTITDFLLIEGILSANGLRPLSSVQNTSAGTLSLTALSTYLTIFVGNVAGQSVRLPDATTIQAGHRFEFHNNSTQLVPVKNGSGSVLTTLTPNQRILAVLQVAGTVAGLWSLTTFNSTLVPLIQSGVVNGASFSGTPTLKYNVVFSNPFPGGTDYAISLTGTSDRNFGYGNKLTTGFTIDSGARSSFTSEVSWIAVPIVPAIIQIGNPLGLLLALTYS